MILPKITAFLVLAGVGAAILAQGCGQMKTQADRVVVVENSPPASGEPSSNTSASSDNADLKQIDDFIKLYFGSEGVTRDGLKNILEKYKDKLRPFLAGLGLSESDLIDILFSFDTNNDGRLTVSDVAQGLNKLVPILRWIPDNDSSITENELASVLAKEYPGTSDVARRGLEEALMQFDEPWAGGNGDERLSRKELSTAGLILGVMGQTDLSHGIALPDGLPSDEATILGQLDGKLNEQIFGRYSESDFKKLPGPDVQRECMQLAMRFYLTDKLTQFYTPDDEKIAPVGAQLLLFYKSAFAGGDGGLNLNTIEAFNLLTDLDYAKKFLATANVSIESPRTQMLESFTALFPQAAPSLSNPGFWSGLKQFDQTRLGGNGDGKLDAEEFTMALAYVRVVETIFETYDANHDGMLSKTEAAPFFQRLGIPDPRVEDAFFADVGLDGSGWLFWEKVKAFFSGRNKIEQLSPYDFYQRLVEILPRVVNKEIAL